jgi:hypothetical protein
VLTQRSACLDRHAAVAEAVWDPWKHHATPLRIDRPSKYPQDMFDNLRALRFSWWTEAKQPRGQRVESARVRVAACVLQFGSTIVAKSNTRLCAAKADHQVAVGLVGSERS